MQARAHTDKKFLYKYLLIGIATFLYSLYCFYDGFLNYPTLIPIAAAHDELLNEIEDQKLATPDGSVNWATRRQSEWEKIANTNGWSAKPPKDTASDVKHFIQYSIGLGAVCAAIGIPCLIWFFRNRGTWLAIDGNTISSSNGKSFEFSQVSRLDKQKWGKKGLATVYFQNASGNEDSLTLDDLKFDRKVVDQMVCELENGISAEKIVNGPTEVELAAKRAEDLAARQQRIAEVQCTDDDE